MTVTKRKQKPRETPGNDPAPNQSLAPTLESGIKASCDSCSADITHSVHVRCAEKNATVDRLTCPDFDLCVDCFLHGKSLGPHRPTHAYRIISSHSFPIFTQLWGADEELLMIEGAEMYGLGNWADISEHVGGRTKEECKEHYEQIYLNSPDWPLPIVETNFSPTDIDTFASLKKTRLEILQSRPLPLPPPKPLASAPTCHEIGGFMPGRLEFEHEFENEAEVLIKDLEFGKVYHFGGQDQPAAPPPPPEQQASITLKEGDSGDLEEDNDDEAKPAQSQQEGALGGEVDGEKEGDEPENELELKMSVLEMFNEKYDKRMAAKDLIFDRGLINYKTISAAERKRNKDERDLITRTKVFARIQTARDHEEFVEGLLYEITLRKRIAELQDYRRNGVTTLAGAAQYDNLKLSRQSAKAASYRDSVSLSFDRGARGGSMGGAGGGGLSASTGSNVTFTSSSAKKHQQQGPLTLATSASLHLLTPLERELCSTLRMLPKPYLFLKSTLLREYVRLKGRMNAHEARNAVKREDEIQYHQQNGNADGTGMGEWGEKIERVWEFLQVSGGLIEPERTQDVVNAVTNGTSRDEVVKMEIES
ncbi:chromatin-binding transcription regulator ADA2 [Sporobolomyces koalae]|uniref:chromatin-binding transcription regulator ADA2 n=1 Tax=Sporobolomyces koalae TaxID=500713 RepID=UPI00317967F8